MSLSSIRIAPSAASRAVNLLRTVQFTHPPSCPCHSNPAHHHHRAPSTSSPLSKHARSLATPIDPSHQKEYAFEMAASSIRFGPGCTQEVGMDFKNIGAKRVCVVTDSNVARLDAMKQVVEGLSKEGVEFTVYDKVRVEPKDYSYVFLYHFFAHLLCSFFLNSSIVLYCVLETDSNRYPSIKDAIAFAKPYNPDAFLAVGTLLKSLHILLPLKPGGLVRVGGKEKW